MSAQNPRKTPFNGISGKSLTDRDGVSINGAAINLHLILELVVLPCDYFVIIKIAAQEGTTLTLYDFPWCMGFKKHAAATGKPLRVNQPRTGLTEQLVTVAEGLNFLLPACDVQSKPSSSVITTPCKKDQPQREYQVAGVAFPADLQGASELLLHSARRPSPIGPPRRAPWSACRSSTRKRLAPPTHYQ